MTWLLWPSYALARYLRLKWNDCLFVWALLKALDLRWPDLCVKTKGLFSKPCGHFPNVNSFFGFFQGARKSFACAPTSQSFGRQGLRTVYKRVTSAIGGRLKSSYKQNGKRKWCDDLLENRFSRNFLRSKSWDQLIANVSLHSVKEGKVLSKNMKRSSCTMLLVAMLSCFLQGKSNRWVAMLVAY